MIEVSGDLWEAHGLGHWVVVTTNGAVRKDGACVMGRGVAQQAAVRFPELPFELGTLIRDGGNVVYAFTRYRILSFPVKTHWREPADPRLITKSARQLVDLLGCTRGIFDGRSIYMVRPGCGNGGLTWEVVKPLLVPILDDRFIVVQKS